jgi:hypothetical protein
VWLQEREAFSPAASTLLSPSQLSGQRSASSSLNNSPAGTPNTSTSFGNETSHRRALLIDVNDEDSMLNGFGPGKKRRQLLGT